MLPGNRSSEPVELQRVVEEHVVLVVDIGWLKMGNSFLKVRYFVSLKIGEEGDDRG